MPTELASLRLVRSNGNPLKPTSDLSTTFVDALPKLCRSCSALKVALKLEYLQRHDPEAAHAVEYFIDGCLRDCGFDWPRAVRVCGFLFAGLRVICADLL